jgi:hypothetical protein
MAAEATISCRSKPDKIDLSGRGVESSWSGPLHGLPYRPSTEFFHALSGDWRRRFPRVLRD